MIRIGSGNASASTRSNGCDASTASSSSAAVARMRGSISSHPPRRERARRGLAQPPVRGRVEADHRGLRLVAAVEQRLADLGRQRDQRQLRVGRAERLRVEEHALDVRVARDDVVVERRRVEDRRASARHRARTGRAGTPRSAGRTPRGRGSRSWRSSSLLQDLRVDLHMVPVVAPPRLRAPRTTSAGIARFRRARRRAAARASRCSPPPPPRGRPGRARRGPAPGRRRRAAPRRASRSRRRCGRTRRSPGSPRARGVIGQAGVVVEAAQVLERAGGRCGGLVRLAVGERGEPVRRGTAPRRRGGRTGSGCPG